MLYRKFLPTRIFTGTEMLGPGNVLIADDQGGIEAIVPRQDAGDDIQTSDGIISPGFVNCHCHLELSHMRGLIPEATGLVDFVFKVVTERHHPDEAIAEAIQKAEQEMIDNGIVAVGDICNNLSTLPQKQKGRLHYYNFIEASGWLPEVAQTRFERSSSFLQAFTQIQNSNSKIQNSLSPHAPYSVSDRLWALMQPFFAGKTISIHNQETAFEDELFRSGSGDFTRMYELMKLDTSFFRPTGKSSLQSYLPKLKDAAEIILVHNTFTTQEDISFAKQSSPNVNWCICIKANRYIEQATPPVELLYRNGCNMVIGTDSLASNNSLDILDELKTIHRSFPAIPFTDLLQWATYNGARALQLQDRIGSFEKGKKPGLILISGLENGNLTERSAVTNLC
ncbi:MAG: amidohydrolase family protein [Chitinophagaceae bacterium]|nr:amidohydrolase family protein [Chitinophagaceae bacterium]